MFVQRTVHLAKSAASNRSLKNMAHRALTERSGALGRGELDRGVLGSGVLGRGVDSMRFSSSALSQPVGADQLNTLAKEQMPLPQSSQHSFSTLADKSTADPVHIAQEDVKAIRMPVGYARKITDAIVDTLKGMSTLPSNEALQSVWRPEQIDTYRRMLILNLVYSEPVMKEFSRAAVGLPLIDAVPNTHMLIEGVDHALHCQKIDPKCDLHRTEGAIRDRVQLFSYYRTPILLNEMERLGRSEDDVVRSTSKAFFLQYHSGDLDDPDIFSPMTREFYPLDSHLQSVSNDLGQEFVAQFAANTAMALEGDQPPLKIINSGDSAPFTEAINRAMLHNVLADKHKRPMPIVFLISANRASISSRIEHDELVDQFKRYGIRHIFSSPADDVVAGITQLRKAVQIAHKANTVTVVISHKSYRAIGHASDGTASADLDNVEQHHAHFKLLLKQLCHASPGMSGPQLAAEIERMRAKVDRSVEHALLGQQILTRSQIAALSKPGLGAEPAGRIVELPARYLTNPIIDEHAQMGSTLYGNAIDRVIQQYNSGDKKLRYVHQENSKPRSREKDARAGVYDELHALSESSRGACIDLPPNEALVAEVGLGYNVAYRKNAIIIAKGPHTEFNVHSLPVTHFASVRAAAEKLGQENGMIYIVDGGNLALNDKRTVTDEQGQARVIETTLAKVGFHHNNPEYRSLVKHDANTLGVVPMDMQILTLMLDNMIDLQQQGRFLYTFAPTASFGMPHAQLDLPALQVNDLLSAKIEGNAPINGKKLVVLSWGPDAKMVAKTLKERALASQLFIFNSIQYSPALEATLAQMAEEGPVEVLTVDPNPEAGLLGDIKDSLDEALEHPNLHFSRCTIRNLTIPVGNGVSLLSPADITYRLVKRGLIAPPEDFDGVCEAVMPSMIAERATVASGSPIIKDKAAPTLASVAPVAANDSKLEAIKVPGSIESGEFIPEDDLEVGQYIEEGYVIGEIESDKATIAVEAPYSGHVEWITDQRSELSTGDTLIRFALSAPMSDEAVSEHISDLSESRVEALENEVLEDGVLDSASNDARLEGKRSVPLSKFQRATVQNMTIQPGDTKTFSVTEPISFEQVLKRSKTEGSSTATLLVRALADAVIKSDLNRKLNSDKSAFDHYQTMNIGVAIDVEGELRVGVLRDVGRLTNRELRAEITRMKEAGQALSTEDQDLSDVTYILSTLGRSAPQTALPVLPRGVTGIVAIGRTDGDQVANVTGTFCHATLNGREAMTLMANMKGEMLGALDES